MDVAAALALAEQIVQALVTVAPAIEKGVVSATPYIQALGGVLSGSNASQEDIDKLLAQLQSDSADFQTPLPPDDGTTTT